MAFLDSIQLGVEAVGIFVLIAFGYYALRLLASFRKGMLEKGWRDVTIGAIILAIAQFPILASGVSENGMFDLLGSAGALLRLTAMIFLILGLRSQYQVWRLDKKKNPAVFETGERIER